MQPYTFSKPNLFPIYEREKRRILEKAKNSKEYEALLQKLVKSMKL